MELLQSCEDNGRTYVEATPEACVQWTEHVHKCSEGLLANEVDSWLTGVNTNVHGKTVRTVARYTGSAVDYRKRCKELQAGGWPGLTFRKFADNMINNWLWLTKNFQISLTQQILSFVVPRMR